MFRTGSAVIVVGIVAAALGMQTSSRLIAQQPEVPAPHRPVAPRAKKQLPPRMPSVTQTLSGGWWNIGQGFKSAIYLTNHLKTDSLTVIPKVYLADGTSYSLTPVKLDPTGTAIVDLSRAFAGRNIVSNTTSGYVEVSYSWPWQAICAFVRNVDVTHSVIFTSPLNPLNVPVANQATSSNTHTFEGLWWKQEKNVSAFLALSNLTGSPIYAKVSVDGDGMTAVEHDLSIPAHATTTLNLSELPSKDGAAGGLRVTYDGPQGGLSLNGGLEDTTSGYSANLPMTAVPDTAPGSTTTVTQTDYAQLGLMNGAADSLMGFPAGVTFASYSVVRNISSQPVTVNPQLWWMAGQVPKSAQMPAITIQPHQTKALDTAAMLAGASLHAFNGSFNLVLRTSGPAGALLAVGGSVDTQNNYVFAATTHGILESTSKSLSYWSTGNGDDTMVTIWNPADETQDFALTLYFKGGHYTLPVQLGPRATEMLNISEVIKNQLPDADGNTVPANVQEGSGEIAGSLGENEHILVGIDAGVYNAQKATCYNGCITCNGFLSAWISSAENPNILNPGDNDQLTFWEQYNTGSNYDATGQSQWNVVNNSNNVATVSNGLAQAVTPGQATIEAIDFVFEPVYAYICSQQPPMCPVGMTYPSASQNVTVLPTVTVSGPSNVPLGTVNTIQLNAVGNPGGGTYSWTASNGNVAFSNTSASTVTVTGSSPGFTTITATYTVNGQSGTGSQTVKVQQPSSLGSLSSTNVPFSCTAYDPSLTYNTSQLQITYDVLDQDGTPITGASLPVFEQFTGVSNSCRGAPNTPPATNGNTNLDGSFPTPDRLTMCSISCMPANSIGQPQGSCLLSVVQTWSANGYPVQTRTINYTCAQPYLQ